MKILKNRLRECLIIASNNWDGFLNIPQPSEVILNREFMKPKFLAHESMAGGMNIISVNSDLVDKNLDFYVSEIIPHELAHVICRINPRDLVPLKHDSDWAELCMTMGGSGRSHFNYSDITS